MNKLALAMVGGLLAVEVATALPLTQPRFDYTGADAGSGLRTEELAVYRPDQGLWSIRDRTGGTGTRQVVWGWNESQPVPGDYDGDGKTDVAVYHGDAGRWFILLSSTGQARYVNWGWNRVIPVPGDYDGDGRTDVAVYYAEGGMWYLLLSSTGQGRFINWGWGDAVPVPADYNGDGSTDIAVYCREEGAWYIRTLSGAVLASKVNWGWREAWPVPADYNGDGKADLAVYHRQSGLWYTCNLNGPVIALRVSWGWNAVTPVPGDYDGDGKADLAVYHRASGAWYVSPSSGSAPVLQHFFGGADACPIQSYASPGTEGITYISFGDSITYGDSSALEGPDSAYPLLLEKKLKVYYGGSFRSINAGRSGEATWQAATRLASVLGFHRSDALLIMEGTNNMLFEGIYGVTERNLRTLATMGVGAGRKVVMATIPPVIASRYVNRTDQARRIRGFNPIIYSLAASLGLRVAPVHETLTSVRDWETRLMDPFTANHPNDAGYLYVRDAFYGILSSGLLDGSLY